MNIPLRTLTALAALSACAGIGIAAEAETSPTDVAHMMEKYVVTGSNIPLAADEPSLPVTVLDRSSIERFGLQTTAELLQTLPQALGSSNYRGEQYPNPGGGEAKIALRGMSASATLVLVNGRRVALTSAITVQNNAVNVNTIPLAAVERVDVLRQGAGPIYGSDAIAGVVNIVLRDNYRGSLLTAEYGNTTDKDAGTVIGSLLVGTGNDATDIVVSGSFFRRNAVYSRDRDIARTADYRRFGAARGGTDRRTPDAPRSHLYVSRTLEPTGVGLIYNGAADGTGTSLDAYRAWTSADAYDFRPFTAEVLPQTRYGVTFSARHKLSDSLRLMAEASYTRVESFTELAPTAVYSDQHPFADAAGNIVQITVPIDNRFNPFGAGSANGKYAVDAFYKRFVELGPRTVDTDVDNTRLLAGVQGKLAGWRWEAAGLYSRDQTRNVSTNLINKSELYSQLQNSNPAVASINVFGDWTYNLKDAAQRAALDRIRLNAVSLSSFTLEQADAKASGAIWDLPAGTVAMAVGAERRRERLSFDPDSAVTSFNTIGSVNQSGTHGSRCVTSAYVELAVPLLKNLPGAYALDVTAAGRFENYSDFGRTTKPGVSLRWKPVGDALALRGSYSEGFRAPTLQELFLGGQESFERLVNPNAPTQVQVRNLRGGNRNLDPEKSRSWNFGVVCSPKWIRNLSLHVDYYSIFKRDNIAFLQAQYVFNQFLAGNPAFQNAVEINPATNFATLIRTPYGNLGREVSRGYDYGFSYVLPTRSLGKFTFDGDGTYLATYLITTDRASAYIEAAGDYATSIGNTLPRNRTRFTARWQYGACDTTLTWRRVAGLKEYISAVKAYHEIEDYNTIDAQVGRSLPGDMAVAVGITNLTDEKVPFFGNAGPNGYDNATYEILGRRYYVRLTKKF